MTPLEFYRQAVLDKTGVSLEQFTSAKRQRGFVEARQAFFLIAHTNTKATYKQIALYAGGKDHSTVIHGISTMKDLMFSQPKKFAWVKELIEQGEPITIRADYNIYQAEMLCASARLSLNKKDVVGAYNALRKALDALASPEITNVLLTLAADQKMFEEVNG
jgi:hypothetical protein